MGHSCDINKLGSSQAGVISGDVGCWPAGEIEAGGSWQRLDEMAQKLGCGVGMPLRAVCLSNIPLSIHPAVCPFTSLSTHPPTHHPSCCPSIHPPRPFSCLSILPSSCLPIHSPVSPPPHLTTHHVSISRVSTPLSIRLPVSPSTPLSVHPTMPLPAHPTILGALTGLSTHPPLCPSLIHLSAHLSFIQPSVQSSMHPTCILPSIRLSIPVCPSSTLPSICLSIHPPTSVCPSIHPPLSVLSSTPLSFLSLCPSTPLSVHPPTPQSP